jgi:hypothetical protein
VYSHIIIIYYPNATHITIIMTTLYKSFTITRDMLPMRDGAVSVKAAGFHRYPQYDLRDQLDYCFNRVKTPIEYATSMNIPTSNNTHLLSLFTQTHTKNESDPPDTSATARTTVDGGPHQPDEPPGTPVQLTGPGSEA